MITFKNFSKQEYENALFVTDENVSKLYELHGDAVYVLPQGESAKTFTQLEKLCSFFLAHNLDRNGTVVAVGGGCVGDVAGLASGIYKRGVKFVNVPTTLIAQIDSAVGGKTAINLDGVKNAVGLFVDEDTVIDVNFLKTLPTEEWLSGQGELIKYRMLSPEVNNAVLTGDEKDVVRACALYKSNVTCKDFFDRGERKMLNAGHTVGHALELTCGLKHGNAVANGLYYELVVAEKLGYASASYRAYWQSEIEKYFEIEELTRGHVALMANDKKNERGRIGFALVGDKGVAYPTISAEELFDIWKI